MNIGDSVYSIVARTMVGKIARLLNNNDAIVMIDDKEILVDLNYWHTITI